MDWPAFLNPFGWFGFGGPSAEPISGAPPDPDKPVDPSKALERNGVNLGGAAWLQRPLSRAPVGDYQTYRWMTSHPTLALMHAVVTDTLLSGTRSVKIKDGNGKGVKPKKPSIGDGVQKSPEDKWAATLESSFRDLWPMLLNAGCRKLQFGHMPGELIWEHKDNLTYIDRFKPLRPWECKILKDDFEDYAGIRYRNQDRDPRYAMNFVNESDLFPLTGRPRLENCREEWWEKIQAKDRGRELDHKATSIVPSVWGPATEEGLAVAKKLAEAISRGEPTFMTYYEVDLDNMPAGNPDAWKREAYKIELHDMGNTGPQSLAILDKLRYIDAELAYGYLMPPQASMEGQQHGAKAVAKVHGQVAVQGMERLHAELIGEVNCGAVRTMTLTNRGIEEADRYYFEGSPFADPQQEFLQSVQLALLANTTEGPDAAGRIDKEALYKRTETPIDPDYKPLPPLPAAPPVDPRQAPAQTNGKPRGRLAVA